MKENIIPHKFKVTKAKRNTLNNHNSFLIWFTGLSGSGKSTIANIVEEKLFKKGIKTYTLDGDNIRSGINKDLTFEPKDRTENIRRIAEVANLMVDGGLVVLAAFVSPYKKDRENIRKIVKHLNFVEVFVNTSLEECERRDVKGLYEKARKGEIKNMTGISAPYESPENPDIEIETEHKSAEENATEVVEYVLKKMQLTNE
ncbi:adenylyl-sulfate kinase [Ichthyenterobacterium sp. W332]|uniref:Adenylyl-sulfate kinase n=1 Tax=Microcosmobacter mediterraneus TaxID=3075607 RepID=A0ABU2YIP6_9FLAO|nr:adenylyl-sulfate kinase [Ichthyenterobacterium sp. W332]MDT0558051.1 adenylyl-sulfate kinase [Ichthyenterobacterium sp. W332]